MKQAELVRAGQAFKNKIILFTISHSPGQIIPKLWNVHKLKSSGKWNPLSALCTVIRNCFHAMTVFYLQFLAETSRPGLPTRSPPSPGWVIPSREKTPSNPNPDLPSTSSSFCFLRVDWWRWRRWLLLGLSQTSEHPATSQAKLN